MLVKSFFVMVASAIAFTDALGINCRGSGLCTGNSGALGQALGQLKGMDQSQTFSDGQHVTCVKSPITIGNPSLCIFYQKTGRQFTVAQTVWYVQALIDHGCGACGSVPTDDGNNVNNGELTANMVTNAKRRDIVAKQVKPEQSVEKNSNSLTKREGINCQGSSTCGVGGIANLPAGTVSKIRDAVAAGPDGSWTDGQHVACVAHATGRLCAFYQKTGGRSFTKAQTLWYIDALKNHGCTVCGSCPTDDGNNVKNGELTVNYVA